MELTVQLQEYLHVHTLNIKVLHQTVTSKPIGKPHCWLTIKLWSCIFAPFPVLGVDTSCDVSFKLCQMLFEIFIRGKQAGERIARITASHLDAERAQFILRSPSVCTVTARSRQRHCKNCSFVSQSVLGPPWPPCGASASFTLLIKNNYFRIIIGELKLPFLKSIAWRKLSDCVTPNGVVW